MTTRKPKTPFFTRTDALIVRRPVLEFTRFAAIYNRADTSNSRAAAEALRATRNGARYLITKLYFDEKNRLLASAGCGDSCLVSPDPQQTKEIAEWLAEAVGCKLVPKDEPKK